jgi:hypothetical protein
LERKLFVCIRKSRSVEPCSKQPEHRKNTTVPTPIILAGRVVNHVCVSITVSTKLMSRIPFILFVSERVLHTAQTLKCSISIFILQSISTGPHNFEISIQTVLTNNDNDKKYVSRKNPSEWGAGAGML